MKILLMRGYFFPETAASNQMCLELIQTMADNGYEIELVTPIPTRGVSKSVRQKYSRIRNEEIYHCVKVKRYWLPQEGKSVVLRAMRYLMQNIYQFMYGLTHKYDILFLYSTPPTNGVVGGILRKLKKRPFIYNLHDVFPDSMLEGGITSEKSLLFKLGRKMENFTYRNSDHIITLSNGIVRNIEKKGVPSGKITVVYNWVDEKKVHKVDRCENTLVSEFGLDPDKFLITYAGNIGVAQDVGTIIDAAKLLTENKNVHFVIIGNGVKEKECQEMAHNLDNVFFFPMQSMERLSEVYSLGDISIVTCKKGFGKCGMPSKTANILSAGTSLVATFDTESDLAEILTENNCGICVEPENPKALANAIENLYWQKQNNHFLEYGVNGRNFVERYLAKSKCTMQIVDIIKSVEGRYGDV